MNNNYKSFKVPETPELEVFYSQAKNDYKGCILCVHGICHGAWCFENFLTFFSNNGYDCYALSFRGHAGSAGYENLNKYRLSDYSDDVKRCIEYCKSEKCKYKMKSNPFLLGHSMGGAVVQKYIGEYPNTVKGAILFASATADRMKRCKTILDIIIKRKLRICAFKSLGVNISDKKIAVSAFFDNRITSKEDIKRYNKKLQKESRWITLWDLYKKYTNNYDIDIPIMVIGSEKDAYFPKKSLVKTVSYYRHVSYELLKDLCHDMMLDPEWEKSARPVLCFMEDRR